MDRREIHYFNPGNETAALNNSPYYTLPANPARMQQDLAFLPAWYGKNKDFIFLENTLDKEFESTIKDINSLPKSIVRDNVEKYRDLLNGVDVSLWGMAPQSVHFFEQWDKKYDLNLKIPSWNNEYQKLISRRTAHTCLSELLSAIPELSSNLLPEFLADQQSIEDQLKAKKYPMLIKAPYSSSGRGLLWIQDPLDRSSRQILQGMLNKQHEVSLEKALNKQVDFAMLFFLNPDVSLDKAVDFRGYSLFQTDNKGNYKGNFVGSQEKIESELFGLVDKDLFEKVKYQLIRFFTDHVASIYQGCICVDMMLYKDQDNIYLHPCVEINFRHTMGWLAMELYRNHFQENISGSFQIEFNKNSLENYENHLKMKKLHPLIIREGKLVSGYLPLCPINENTCFSASLLA